MRNPTNRSTDEYVKRTALSIYNGEGTSKTMYLFAKSDNRCRPRVSLHASLQLPLHNKEMGNGATIAMFLRGLKDEYCTEQHK